MTTKTDGGHAFPTQTWENDGDQVLQYQEPGMSLRDWFAGLAMQAAATYPARADRFTIEQRAWWAYRQADAMLAARENT